MKSKNPKMRKVKELQKKLAAKYEQRSLGVARALKEMPNKYLFRGTVNQLESLKKLYHLAAIRFTDFDITEIGNYYFVSYDWQQINSIDEFFRCKKMFYNAINGFMSKCNREERLGDEYYNDIDEFMKKLEEALEEELEETSKEELEELEKELKALLEEALKEAEESEELEEALGALVKEAEQEEKH